jgi:spore protease
MGRRTDLAVEERELWQQSAGYTTQLPGVRARENTGKGITTTWVDILDDRGAKALHKPIGAYITLELDKDVLRSPAGFSRAAERLGRTLGKLLPQGQALVVGLGNESVTPDAVGPRALDHLLVTRHLEKYLPNFRSVSAIAPGVLGTTGMESVEVVRGIVERTHPECVIVLDALASRSLDRLCTTVQITDAGITPGSGVGNSRAAFNRETLGVPVCAVGVPTVVDVATYMQDML